MLPTVQSGAATYSTVLHSSETRPCECRVGGVCQAVWEYARGAANRKKNFTENTVTDDSLELWVQRTFQPYGAYGFIRFR